MAHPAGESKDGVLRLDFDRRLMLQFRGSVVTSDAGLLAYRELDDAIGLSAVAGETLADTRRGKNGRHALVGLLRQSVFGRLAGYDDVNELHALAYNLGNFLRTLATPELIKDWSLTSLKEKLIKIGAKVVRHGRYVAFQMAEVAIPRQMFQEILRLIAELRPQPPPAPA
jgi:hypothetical protein